MISRQKTQDTIELTIIDNGIGMSEDQLAKKQTLRTLKLRAKDIHGSLVIESKPEHGTKLRLTIPSSQNIW